MDAIESQSEHLLDSVMAAGGAEERRADHRIAAD
jgi:hypothetical protein